MTLEEDLWSVMVSSVPAEVLVSHMCRILLVVGGLNSAGVSVVSSDKGEEEV